MDLKNPELLLFPEWEESATVPSSRYSSPSIIPDGLSLHYERIMKFQNLHLIQNAETEGFLQLPKANAINIEVPEVFFPAHSIDVQYGKQVGIHHFYDDYKFNPLWARLESHFKSLIGYDMVLTPDFSVYVDTPLCSNIDSLYKTRVFTLVGQRCGLPVVPTFTCGHPDYLQLFCDGIPENSLVAVGAMGTNRDNTQKQFLKYCVKEMCKIKHPTGLLVYGSEIDLGIDIPVYYIPSFSKILNSKYHEKTIQTVRKR